MNPNEEKINSDNINELKLSSQVIEDNETPLENEDNYKFGWSNYSEKTNGRFAMLGFLAVILIELLSKQSFFKWAGIL